MNPALVVSIVAVTFTALNLLLTFVLVPYREQRKEIRQARRSTVSRVLTETISGPVADARHIIGRATRTGPGKSTPLNQVHSDSRDRVAQTNKYLLQRQEDAIGAAFTAMWHLELVQLRLSQVAGHHEVVSHDIVALYRHVDLMARELESFLVGWSATLRADDTVEATNNALERLPDLIDESTGSTVLPTSARLPVSSVAKARLKSRVEQRVQSSR